MAGIGREGNTVDRVEEHLRAGSIGSTTDPKPSDLAGWLLEGKWRKHFRWKWLVVGAIGSCIVYALLVLVVAWSWDGKTLADIGTLGDSFGALNTLFSALALFGVIVTIAMQSRELELQREELTKLTLESQRAATAQENMEKLQLEELRRTNDSASDRAQPIFELRSIEYYIDGELKNAADFHSGSYVPEEVPCNFVTKLILQNVGDCAILPESLEGDWECVSCQCEDWAILTGTLMPTDFLTMNLGFTIYDDTTQFSKRLIKLSYVNRFSDKFIMMGYIQESPKGPTINWVGSPVCVERRVDLDLKQLDDNRGGNEY